MGAAARPLSVVSGARSGTHAVESPRAAWSVRCVSLLLTPACVSAGAADSQSRRSSAVVDGATKPSCQP